MNNKFGLAAISFLTIFLFSCNSGPEKTDNSTTQAEAKSNPDSSKNAANNDKTSFHNKENNKSETFELLQGKWQHIEDKTNYLVFEGDHRMEIAEGMDKWDDEIFTLSGKCANQSDKDNGAGSEKDRYISCIESDLCWYIIYLNKESLSLSYMGRGNTLTYKRVR